MKPLVCCLLLVAACSTEPAKPNFVFFLVDDLGYMDVGAYNPETFYSTPNTDRLASEGMRFTNGYAASPVCSPTRYSILTGKYPSRVDATNFFSGVRSGRFRPAVLHSNMPQSEVTIAEALKSEGYRTFFAGKWHLGPTPDFWPENQGFEVNAGGYSEGAPVGGNHYFSPYDNPRLSDGPVGEHLPMRLANETIQFIETHRDEPFLAYLSFYSVHTPLQARSDWSEAYWKKAANLSGPQFGREEKVSGYGYQKVRVEQRNGVYASMVQGMDTAVGMVLDKLDDLELANRTVVIFMSDNGGLSTSEGWPTSNMPLRGGKGWIYEGGIREPFMIKWPGVTQAGSTSDQPVTSTDFYPTMLDIAGLPARPKQTLDGVSLVPILRGENGVDRDALYWHYPHYSNQGGFPAGAVRFGDYKLVERFESGRVHLYDLKSDIGERDDLAAKDPARVAMMRKMLHAWYQTVDAKFLRREKNGPIPWRPVGSRRPD